MKIRTLRKTRRLTLESLAARAGLSRSYLTEIELGHKTPNLKRLEAIATALRVHPAVLIDRHDDGDEIGELISCYCTLTGRKRQSLINRARLLAGKKIAVRSHSLHK